MKVLLDTNILLRLSERGHPHHFAAIESLRRLSLLGHTFCIGSQTISEFLAVATRSIGDRGLGMDPPAADTELSKVAVALDVLYDSPAAVAELRRLDVADVVVGKSIHDAKLAAAAIANGVTQILTFNSHDFRRYPEITVLEPTLVAQAP